MSTPTVTPLDITYIDPDGNSWNLTDFSMQNGYVCSALSGIEGLPVSMTTVPMIDGTAQVSQYLPQPGSINLAILVDRDPTDSENNYYAMLDRVTQAFYNRRNRLPVPGYIQIQRPDGSTRQIAVYTTSGLDTPSVGIHNTLYTFTLQTPEPVWYDINTQSITFVTSFVAGILPVLPVGLGSSAVIGATNINNISSMDAYPTWLITGPGTPTLQNVTTGLQWSLNTSIPSGHVVQVTTKPGSQAVVDITSSTNMWGNLVIPSLRSLWSLVPGNNQIVLSMPGSTAATSIALTYQYRWLRA